MAKVVKIIVALLMLIAGRVLPAQDSDLVSKMFIKNNTMILNLNRNLNSASLSNFTAKYNLKEIGLHELILSGKDDSLKKRGWKTNASDPNYYVIEKPLSKADNLNNYADKIIFSSIPTPDNWRVQGGNRVIYGVNKFKNKKTFKRDGDVVQFTLDGYENAKQVRLAGNFTNWQYGAFPMTKTEKGWTALVKLEEGAYYYKFIINNNHWITDPNNELSENDGRGNINSVFYITNKTFRLQGYSKAQEVFIAGSFNNWVEDQLYMQKTAEGWQLDMYLEPGTHRFQYFVDGEPVPGEKEALKGKLSTEIGAAAYVFKLEGYTNAKKVALTGNFNDWDPDEIWMKRTETGWIVSYVLGPGNYQYKFVVDGEWVTDTANTSVVDDKKGNQNSFLVIKPNYRFRLRGYEKARNVFVAGDFNDWAENLCPLKKVNGEWIADAYLGRGKHRYKFIVDGKWILDPANKLWEDNEHGTGNSVVWLE
jgi:hypothetical protein